MKGSDENEEIDAEWRSLDSLNEAAATVKTMCLMEQNHAFRTLHKLDEIHLYNKDIIYKN